MSFRIYILFLFEYFRNHKLGTFFALSGISLGVGLFISTTANGIKAEKSLTDFAMGYFQGEYKIKISSSLGDQNLPVSLIRELSEDTNLTWIKKIVPRFQKEIIVNDSVRAVYIGLDFLKESGNLRYKPDAEHVESLIFISSSLSKKIDISKINIRADSRKFTLAKPVVLETEGGSILMEDIESAMERFDLKEHVSFLLIQPNEFRSEQKKNLRTKIRSRLQSRNSRRYSRKIFERITLLSTQSISNFFYFPCYSSFYGFKHYVRFIL